MDNYVDVAKEFFVLERGYKINNPENLLFVEEIKIDTFRHKVYFKRKTLKHFIERRKQDLTKRNSEEKAFKIIEKMLLDLPFVIKEYSEIEINSSRENSYILYKRFEKSANTPLTIILEKEKDNQIIISYFFTKR